MDKNETIEAGNPLPQPLGSALIGASVEWTDDLRPHPDNCMGDYDACVDHRLIFKRTGTVVAVERSFWGAWKCLVKTDGGFKTGYIDKDIRDLIFITPNTEGQTRGGSRVV